MPKMLGNIPRHRAHATSNRLSMRASVLRHIFTLEISKGFGAYRHVEFILGNKSRRMAGVHANNPDVFPAIRAALNSPSLYAEFAQPL
jgi:tryptophan 2,3-dioxygenase